MRRVALSLLLPIPAVLVAAALGACSKSDGVPQSDPRAAGTAATTPSAGPRTAGNDGPSDAGAQKPGEPAPYNGPWFGATVFQALVLSDMEWPNKENKVAKLGYLRQGSKAPVIPEPHKKSNCTEGWYELVDGGFVCGKYGTLDMNHPRFRQGHLPDMNAPLPYTYGMNSIQGTPLYRSVPSRDDRKKYEPWLFTHKTANAGQTPSPRSTSTHDVAPPPPAYATTSDGGVLPMLPPANDPAASATAGTSASPPPPPDEEDETPWYLKDYDGGAQPQVTLEELAEEGEGPVARRMVKGFYVSLDKKFESGDNHFWRLIDGLIAPASAVWPAKPQVEYHGVWLDQPVVDSGQDGGAAETMRVDHLPVGFIFGKTPRKWIMADSHKSVTPGGALKHWAAIQLTDQVVTINGTEYFETTEGWWLRGLDATRTEPGTAPEGLGADEKWIDVNLKRQTLVAFVGDKAVFATMVSSGRHEHDTPPGTFRIREKHISATMDGDAEKATDGPYSIQDVPYIEYFNGSYALHGAFWHSNFGHVQSHGCVNLSPLDAKSLFGWTEPQLPRGWHGVWATKDKPGTRVIVHY